ncbi:hypothetical protein O181_099067 [Austropuccinia psidii MF-1]|uniref:Uncharacterized protein n=1 Tax=Austropuccinia psidii MF-1 TaxID=1389203 RepID=A0A9Q3JCI8_9BASI|nr:hypothetical protein [Austropuccinia psidii MF-1]
MPVQHSPPAIQTKSQATAQAFLTPAPRVPLDGTLEVPQLRAQLDRGPVMGGEAPPRKEGRGTRRSNSFSGVVGELKFTPRTTLKGLVEDGEEEEENCVEEEEPDGTEVVPAPVGESEGTGEPILARSNQPFSPQYEPSLLAIIKKMTQIIAHLQSASSSEVPRPPSFNTPSMKAPDFSYVTQPFKVRKSEAESDGLRMKEGGHVSLYIADLSRLVSQIWDWGERAFVHHSRKGLASHPSMIGSLQELMDVTLEIDNRYNDKQKKNCFQEKKTEVSSQVLLILKIPQSQVIKRISGFRKRTSPILPS